MEQIFTERLLPARDYSKSGETSEKAKEEVLAPDTVSLVTLEWARVLMDCSTRVKDTKTHGQLVWWHESVTPLRKSWQEDQEFKG